MFHVHTHEIYEVHKNDFHEKYHPCTHSDKYVDDFGVDRRVKFQDRPVLTNETGTADDQGFRITMKNICVRSVDARVFEHKGDRSGSGRGVGRSDKRPALVASVGTPQLQGLR